MRLSSQTMGTLFRSQARRHFSWRVYIARLPCAQLIADRRSRANHGGILNLISRQIFICAPRHAVSRPVLCFTSGLCIAYHQSSSELPIVVNSSCISSSLRSDNFIPRPVHFIFVEISQFYATFCSS